MRTSKSSIEFVRLGALETSTMGAAGSEKRSKGTHQISVLYTTILYSDKHLLHCMLRCLAMSPQYYMNSCNIFYIGSFPSYAIPVLSMLCSQKIPSKAQTCLFLSGLMELRAGMSTVSFTP